MPEQPNGFYKEQYFEQLNKRLDTLEEKIDDLSKQMAWVKAWASVFGALASLVVQFLIK